MLQNIKSVPAQLYNLKQNAQKQILKVRWTDELKSKVLKETPMQMRVDNKNKQKTIKQESGGSASKREQSLRQTKETGFWMNEQ